MFDVRGVMRNYRTVTVGDTPTTKPPQMIQQLKRKLKELKKLKFPVYILLFLVELSFYAGIIYVFATILFLPIFDRNYDETMRYFSYRLPRIWRHYQYGFCIL